MFSADKLMHLDAFVINEFFNLYCELIESNISTQSQRGVAQRHHIVPKYYFKRANLPVDNSSENIVNLEYKDHILAHYYLSLCSKYSEELYANLIFLNFALRGTNKNFKKILSNDLLLLENLQKEYNRIWKLKCQEKHELYLQQQQEKLKEWVSEQHHCKRCGKVMTEKYGSGTYCCKTCAATHSHTEETKELLRRLNYANVCGRRGIKSSEKTKKLQSESMKKHYADVDYIYMTKDSKDIRIDPKEVDYYLSLGYTRGQSVLKGRTPWNKGLTKDDPRVMDNAEKRNETMLKRYGTLNGNIFKNKETE